MARPQGGTIHNLRTEYSPTQKECNNRFIIGLKFGGHPLKKIGRGGGGEGKRNAVANLPGPILSNTEVPAPVRDHQNCKARAKG